MSAPPSTVASVRTTYDATADAAYIYLIDESTAGRSVRTPEVRTQNGSVILDLDADGVLLGVEVLGARATLHPDLLAGAERLEGTQPFDSLADFDRG